ncbi:HEAT repeat domain-containing protein [Streptomyces sp. HU2014]|uniref:HEAT repeat domain-containing protein n=1 Tax=Streptomyces sp. HU2014 TaxID=2939414 RepID=UPI00200E141D|nr:HEAT repeat domain-containing protein [Streptomyces sp. HU2014]UQI48509.1 HEAT repeat domain-containing protein [Streptomyces sp. HU2014]
MTERARADRAGLLLAALDAYDARFADELMLEMPPAEVNAVGADGRTPLLRAVDLGSYALVERVVDRGGDLRFRGADGRDALALAWHWHEAGAEAELRRRTGATGPVGRGTVEDGFGGTSEELTLGGVTARDGHAAIATYLEPAYGITRTFDELLARAVAEPDVDRSVWGAATYAVHEHLGLAAWDAAEALCDRPDPLERHFGAEVLRFVVIADRLMEVDEDDESPYDTALVELFLPWLERETDRRVVRALTAGLSNARDPRADEPLPALSRSADADTRKWALSGLSYPVAANCPEAVAAVVERLRDEDPKVRQAAVAAFMWGPAEKSSVIADALAERLTDDDPEVRVTAAVRLAMRDDPRGDDVIDGLGPVDEETWYRWGLADVWSYRRRRAEETEAAAEG